MTPKEQELALAQACPELFEIIDFNNQPMIRYRNGPTNQAVDVFNDLNALNKAEGTLTPDQHYDFRRNLWNITEAGSQLSGFPNHLINGEEHNRRYCSALASQRLEALIRTFGLWK